MHTLIGIAEQDLVLYFTYIFILWHKVYNCIAMKKKIKYEDRNI